MIANQEVVECYATFTQNVDGVWKVWIWDTAPENVGEVFRIRIPIPQQLLTPVVVAELVDEKPPSQPPNRE